MSAHLVPLGESDEALLVEITAKGLVVDLADKSGRVRRTSMNTWEELAERLFGLHPKLRLFTDAPEDATGESWPS